MKLKCKACGNTERFIGWQPASGSAHVLVDGDGDFVSDVGDPVDDLWWDEPEGPWQCAKCDSKEVEEE
jgi:hypothetical protein